jgi:hypothetical protein
MCAVRSEFKSARAHIFCAGDIIRDTSENIKMSLWVHHPEKKSRAERDASVGQLTNRYCSVTRYTYVYHIYYHIDLYSSYVIKKRYQNIFQTIIFNRYIK